MSIQDDLQNFATDTRNWALENKLAAWLILASFSALITMVIGWCIFQACSRRKFLKNNTTGSSPVTLTYDSTGYKSANIVNLKEKSEKPRPWPTKQYSASSLHQIENETAKIAKIGTSMEQLKSK